MTTTQALAPADLDALRSRDPFVRWHVPVDSLAGGWGVGTSVALIQERPPRRVLPGPWAILLGEADEVAVLVEALPDLLGGIPAGVTADAHVFTAVPESWPLVPRPAWDYLATTVAPADDSSELPPGAALVDVTDTDAVNAVLDVANQDAHARPGDPDEHSWLGVRDESGLACVGGLTVTDNGGGHLRAITTLPRARGRGYGRVLSAALTRRGLEQVSPEVTLGVYADNLVAVRLYRRLGYTCVHHFVSAAIPDVQDRSECAQNFLH